MLPTDSIPATAEIVVNRAVVEDAAPIQSLQYLFYQSEAKLYNAYSILPLVQSLEDIRAKFNTHVFLAARAGSQIAGPVRALPKAEPVILGG